MGPTTRSTRSRGNTSLNTEDSNDVALSPTKRGKGRAKQRGRSPKTAKILEKEVEEEEEEERDLADEVIEENSQFAPTSPENRDVDELDESGSKLVIDDSNISANCHQNDQICDTQITASHQLCLSVDSDLKKENNRLELNSNIENIPNDDNNSTECQVVKPDQENIYLQDSPEVLTPIENETQEGSSSPNLGASTQNSVVERDEVEEMLREIHETEDKTSTGTSQQEVNDLNVNREKEIEIDSAENMTKNEVVAPVIQDMEQKKSIDALNPHKEIQAVDQEQEVKKIDDTTEIQVMDPEQEFKKNDDTNEIETIDQKVLKIDGTTEIQAMDQEQDVLKIDDTNEIETIDQKVLKIDDKTEIQAMDQEQELLEIDDTAEIQAMDQEQELLEIDDKTEIQTVDQEEDRSGMKENKNIEDTDSDSSDSNPPMIGPAEPPKEFFEKKLEDSDSDDSDELDEEKEKVKSPEKKMETVKSPKKKKETVKSPEKEAAPVIEYIKEYSGESKKKKSNLNKKVLAEKTTVNASKDEENSSTIPTILKVADPVSLEKETEHFYKEMTENKDSSNSAAKTVKEKPKCLTPAEIAKIAKSYPTTSGKNQMTVEMQTAWATLHQYWTHVQENPYDFDGWTYLMNHVETMDNIEAARSAFEGFLPLYPYCFAYWKKHSDLELKFADADQCLGVLYNGTKSVPFSADLWMPLLNQFLDYSKKEDMSEESIRGMFEFAVENVGLAWQSSSIWQIYIDYEQEKVDLVRVLDIYRRLLSVPNKLFNKHWDHALALIRDHHPRNYLSVNEYFKLKKHVSDSLNIKFIPPPMVPPKHLLKIPVPEDPVLTAMKEKVVACLIPDHEANEEETSNRWKFEDKIKRPYFHVKPLERKQLKNWREYLEFELKHNDPVRVVSLFERCLVPCAMYEEFWCQYSEYMESHVRNVVNGKYKDVVYKPSLFQNKLPETDATKKQTQPFDFWESPDTKPARVSREIKFEVRFLLNRLGQGIGLHGKVIESPELTPNSILHSVTWEEVRKIYQRAAWIHCPSKPKLLMQWAEFEESQGNVQTARELLNNVISKNTMFLAARIQLIELERRSEQYDRVEELYAQTFSTFKDSRIKSCIAIKYARFLFKIKEEVEKSLMILRKAMKKDKTNVHLYHHVFDICYQRRPVDVHGVMAAVMLALSSKEMPLHEKNWFCIKRLDFLREHGSITQFKHAKVEAEEIRLKYEAEKVEEAKKKLEDEEAKKKEEEKKEEEASIVALLETEKKKEEPMMIVIDDGEDESEKRRRSESPHSRRSRRKERREKGEIREHRSTKRTRRSPDSSKTRPKKRTKDDQQNDDVMYASDGSILYNPQSENQDPRANQAQVPVAFSGTNVTMQQPPPLMAPLLGPPLGNFGPPMTSGAGGPPFPQHGAPPNFQANQPLLEEPSYRTVPPTWEQQQLVSSNYGYASSHSVTKDNQNTLYNRYYDLVSQRFTNNQDKPMGPSPVQYETKTLDEAMAVNAAAASVAGCTDRDPNSYLPPPPIPQGILGDSLFNQSRSPAFPMQGQLANNSRMPLMHPSMHHPPQLSQPPPQQQQHHHHQSPFRESKRHNQRQQYGKKKHGHGPKEPPRPKELARPIPHLSETTVPAKNTEISNVIKNSEQETTVVSSGRNTIDVIGLLKKQRSVSTENEGGSAPPVIAPPVADDEVKILPSGRNAINVMAIMRDRKNSLDTQGQIQSQPLVGLNTNGDNLMANSPKQPLLGIAPHIKSVPPINGALNVPDWLVQDGGELKLSNSTNGESMIRFWPRFMNENGHKTLFQSLRKSIKWHQSRYATREGKLVSLAQLVSWVGPCDYEKDGFVLEANTNWPPEIVDLLHRLIQFTNSSFNSCYLNLFTNGYAYQPWTSDKHQALEKQPTIASISLGTARTLEMRRVGGSEYIRIPLFPGSLCILDGAVQDDWQWQIPKDSQCTRERISVSFRTMLMIEGVTI